MGTSKLSKKMKRLSKTVTKQTKHTPVLRTVGKAAVAVLSFVATKTDPRHVRKMKRQTKKRLQKHAQVAKAHLKHS